MQYRELAHVYEKIEATTKRLEMRSILVDLLRPLRGRELTCALYLSQGSLRPEYEGVELGVAESLARKAIAEATGTSAGTVGERTRTSGDLGTTAGELLRTTRRLEDTGPLELLEVYDALTGMARATGAGSQETKVQILVDLLRRATPVEGKYLVRFVMGTLRVGVREMTILDALAAAFASQEKDARERIEAAFNLTSDLGLIAEKLASGGVASLASIHLEVGRPIRPMLAERAKSLEELLQRMDGKAAFEYKYDGLRVQAHLAKDGSVRLFSRRLEEIGPQFPDLAKALPSAIRERPAILEGECVPFDRKTGAIRPFQDVATRRGRKHDLERALEEVPVVLFTFDVLLAGSESVYERPFPERRAILEKLVKPSERIRIAEEQIVSSVEEANDYFEEVVGQGAEGVMAKSLADGSRYHPGARGFWWIKYKRDYVTHLADSIDGVVVGAFYGRGRRAGAYGALLLAVYRPDKDRFETFCKVGSGFDDSALAELPKRLAPFRIDHAPPEVDTGLSPDQWFRPSVVLEVKGAELTVSPVHRAGIGAIRPDAGLALRFPRFTGRYRTDKAATQATTSAELVEMYRMQDRSGARAAAAERRVRHKT